MHKGILCMHMYYYAVRASVTEFRVSSARLAGVVRVILREVVYMT